MSALTTGERVLNFENRYRTKDGSYKWLQWQSSPFPMQGLVYATARDVTEPEGRGGRAAAIRRRARGRARTRRSCDGRERASSSPT
jgi:PAS domain-containing protein